MQLTYSTVATSWKMNTSLFVLHVNQQAANLWQGVLKIVEVCQEVHNSVTNLSINWLSVSHTHQWTWIV